MIIEKRKTKFFSKRKICIQKMFTIVKTIKESDLNNTPSVHKTLGNSRTNFLPFTKFPGLLNCPRVPTDHQTLERYHFHPLSPDSLRSGCLRIKLIRKLGRRWMSRWNGIEDGWLGRRWRSSWGGGVARSWRIWKTAGTELEDAREEARRSSGDGDSDVDRGSNVILHPFHLVGIILRRLIFLNGGSTRVCPLAWRKM
jgi:hypothetical protein